MHSSKRSWLTALALGFFCAAAPVSADTGNYGRLSDFRMVPISFGVQYRD